MLLSWQQKGSAWSQFFPFILFPWALKSHSSFKHPIRTSAILFILVIAFALIYLIKKAQTENSPSLNLSVIWCVISWLNWWLISHILPTLFATNNTTRSSIHACCSLSFVLSDFTLNSFFQFDSITPLNFICYLSCMCYGRCFARKMTDSTEIFSHFFSLF